MDSLRKPLAYQCEQFWASFLQTFEFLQ